MVVDDLHYFGVLDTGGRLGHLVVIHQNDLLHHGLAIALDGVHAVDEHRLGDVVALEEPGAFHGQRAQAGGHVFHGLGFAVAGGQGVLQMRIPHSGGNGVVVGIAMAHDENLGGHEFPFLGSVLRHFTVLKQYTPPTAEKRWAMIAFLDECRSSGGRSSMPRGPSS